MTIAAPVTQYMGKTTKPKPVAQPLKAKQLPKKRKTIADK